MKKLLFAFAATLLSAVLFLSCKKDNPVPKAPAASIAGYWKGKYGLGSAVYPNLRYAILFRNDGTLRVFNNTDTSIAEKAEGTYTQTGVLIQATYSYLNSGFQYSIKCAVNQQFTFVEGFWGFGQNQTNGGRFFVTKQ